MNRLSDFIKGELQEIILKVYMYIVDNIKLKYIITYGLIIGFLVVVFVPLIAGFIHEYIKY